MVDNWQQTASTIEAIEKKLFEKKISKDHSYRLFGRWLIRSGPWPQTPGRVLKGIPGMSALPAYNPKQWKSQLQDGGFSTVAGPLLGWFIGPKQQAKLEADAIYAFKYLVAIYLEQGLVVKTALTDEALQAVKKEAETLAWLNDHVAKGKEKVEVPDLLEAFLDREVPFFVQQLVTGRSLQEKYGPVGRRLKAKGLLDILGQVLQFSWRIYEKHGLEPKPVEKAYPKLYKLKLHKLEQEELLEQRFSMELVDLFKDSRPLIEENRLLPCSLTHNDLSAENIIVGRDKLWLIDWGSARVAPVIADQDNLITLSGYNSHFMEKVFARLEQAGNSAAYSPQEQQLLGRLDLLLSLIKSYLKASTTTSDSKRVLSYYPLDKRIEKEMINCRRMLDRLK